MAIMSKQQKLPNVNTIVLEMFRDAKYTHQSHIKSSQSKRLTIKKKSSQRPDGSETVTPF